VQISVIVKNEEHFNYWLGALPFYDNAKIMMKNNMIKDAINRSYYATFYALKAVLALEEKDFKRHKEIASHHPK
jgi:uncharacterized protein (UPF0332 family)